MTYLTHPRPSSFISPFRCPLSVNHDAFFLPQDATWASATNSLKCYTPTDIFLLLKCSDVISHDVCEASVVNGHSMYIVAFFRYDRCPHPHPARPSQFFVVLREYISFHQSNEFRCFIRNKELIGLRVLLCLFEVRLAFSRQQSARGRTSTFRFSLEKRAHCAT